MLSSAHLRATAQALKLQGGFGGRRVEPEGSGTLLQLRTIHRRLGPVVALWGLNTHFLNRRSCQDCGWCVCLQCLQAWLLRACQTLGDPTDCSPPGSSVHGILQARILEWVAVPPPGGLPDPGIEPRSLTSPAWQVGSLPLVPPGKPKMLLKM